MSASPQHPKDNPARRVEPAENANVYERVLDSHGWPIWEKAPDGKITYSEHDPVTGLLTRCIRDVSLFLYNIETLTAGHGAPVPKGWKTPPGGGVHETWQYEHDSLHRITRIDMSFHPGEEPHFSEEL